LYAKATRISKGGLSGGAALDAGFRSGATLQKTALMWAGGYIAAVEGLVKEGSALQKVDAL
jgi:hypothetical protein